MVCFRTKGRDNTFGIVTSLRLDNRGKIVRLPTDVRNFSPLQRVHTGSGSHPGFCSANTGDYFRRSTAAGGRSWKTPPSADIKVRVELYFHTLICLYGMHCNYFTLYDLNTIDLTKPYNVTEIKYDQMRQETNDNIINGQAKPCMDEKFY